MKKEDKDAFVVVGMSMVCSIIICIIVVIVTPEFYKSALFNKVTEEDYKSLVDYATTIAKNYDVASVQDENIIKKEIIYSENSATVIVEDYKAGVEVKFYKTTEVQEIEGKKGIIQTIHYNNPVDIKYYEITGSAPEILIILFCMCFVFFFGLWFIITIVIEEKKQKKQRI